MTFSDHFSKQAATYARYRPTYPDELYSFLVANVSKRERAWDCATGSGQAAVGLAAYFSEVIATDASESQVQNAIPHPKIKYSVAPAESSHLPSDSVDLVTVASGVHWFDLEAFYAEAKRVLRKDGLIAVWVYNGWSSAVGLDSLFSKYEQEIVGPFWPPQVRRWVWTDYRDLPFPFERIPCPSFSMTMRLNREKAVGLLKSWSATQRFIEAKRQDPLELIEEDLNVIFRNRIEGDLTARINLCVGKA